MVYLAQAVERLLFPFLIGKVLTPTKPEPTKPTTPEPLPFLIGKVLTRKKAEEDDEEEDDVSIPYR